MLKLSKSKQLLTVICGLCCAFLLAQIKTVSALNCYTCSYLLDYSDQTCLVNANLTRITNCTMKYCTTIRQEAINNASKVISFLRDCQDKPLFLNSVQKDSTFRTYYRACQTDLCNDSNGKSAIIDNSSTQNATVANNQSIAPNGIIKGKNGKDSLHQLSNGLCMFIAFGLYFVYIL